MIRFKFQSKAKLSLIALVAFALTSCVIAAAQTATTLTPAQQKAQTAKKRARQPRNRQRQTGPQRRKPGRPRRKTKPRRKTSPVLTQPPQTL